MNLTTALGGREQKRGETELNLPKGQRLSLLIVHGILHSI